MLTRKSDRCGPMRFPVEVGTKWGTVRKRVEGLPRQSGAQPRAPKGRANQYKNPHRQSDGLL
jgi:hypothetical protein